MPVFPFGEKFALKNSIIFLSDSGSSLIILYARKENMV